MTLSGDHTADHMKSTNPAADISEICAIIRETVDTEKIYLFGSYAYGTPNEDSDYDICIIIPDDYMRPIDAMKKIRRALYPVQTVPMDMLVYTESGFRKRLTAPTLEKTIADKGLLLYEKALEETSASAQTL